MWLIRCFHERGLIARRPARALLPTFSDIDMCDVVGALPISTAPEHVAPAVHAPLRPVPTAQRFRLTKLRSETAAIAIRVPRAMSRPR